MDAFDASPLCPAPIELQLDEIRFAAPELIITAHARRRVVACPVCGHAASRVHSRYKRTLADLPSHSLRVRLELRARRFFCDLPQCPRRIFTERLPTTTTPYARRTRRAATALETIALALGGRAGARLAQALGFGIGPTALIAQLRHDGAPPTLPETGPRVLGIDDWAWRKGQRYGTILVDLEQHRVVDLLPDREPATLAAWLQAHPGVAFISRDRAGAYADGAQRGAPEAIQIADRFHLLRNFTDAMQRLVERQGAAIRRIGLTPREPQPTPVERGPVGRPRDALRRAAAQQLARRQARREQYERVVTLQAGGATISDIHRQLGLSRATIMRWLRADVFPERRPVHRRTSVDEHAEFLTTRWHDGCHNAALLWRALRDERGFRGGQNTVRDWVRAHLRAIAHASSRPSPLPARPSARRAAWLLTTPTDRLNAAERAYVDAVCAAVPALDIARRLATEFRVMLQSHDPNRLPAWLAKAESSELRQVAAGFRRDYDAVLAAVVFRWSNGQVEGQVNRLKLVKRQMYGRAGFRLLRRRVLAA